MDFDFSDDQEQLRDAVRKWVDKGYTFERRRAAVAAGGFDRAAFHVGFSGGCFRFAGGWSNFFRYGWRGFLLSGNRSGFFLSVRFIVRVLFLAFTVFYRKRLLRRWGFGMPCSMRQRREG